MWDERIRVINILPSLLTKPWKCRKNVFSVFKIYRSDEKNTSKSFTKSCEVAGAVPRTWHEVPATATSLNKLTASEWGSFRVGHVTSAIYSVQPNPTEEWMGQAHICFWQKAVHLLYTSAVLSHLILPVHYCCIGWSESQVPPFFCLPSITLWCVYSLFHGSDSWEFLFSIQKNSSNSWLPSDWQL